MVEALQFIKTLLFDIMYLFMVFAFIGCIKASDTTLIKWSNDIGNSLSQSDEFYGSTEAVRIAETVILFQRNNGGWPKNYDRVAVVTDSISELQIKYKTKTYTTFDNGSTHSDVRFLSKVYNKTGDDRFKNAAIKGVEFILSAQYANGGWPQLYPLPKGEDRYERHITFNDGAMIGILTTLREIVNDDKTYSFLGKERRSKAKQALNRGVQCILDCQYKVGGVKMAWGAQHHAETLKPTKARTYELPSLAGYESLYIVRFLMEIENPSTKVQEAIHSAVKWFKNSKIIGWKQVDVKNALTPKGWDRMVVADSTAAPMWARFYDLETNQPFFCGRNGIPKRYLAEIEYERRVGYSWLGFYGKNLVSRDYPNWLKRTKIEEKTLFEEN